MKAQHFSLQTLLFLFTFHFITFYAVLKQFKISNQSLKFLLSTLTTFGWTWTPFLFESEHNLCLPIFVKFCILVVQFVFMLVNKKKNERDFGTVYANLEIYTIILIYDTYVWVGFSYYALTWLFWPIPKTKSEISG